MKGPGVHSSVLCMGVTNKSAGSRVRTLHSRTPLWTHSRQGTRPQTKGPGVHSSVLRMGATNKSAAEGKVQEGCRRTLHKRTHPSNQGWAMGHGLWESNHPPPHHTTSLYSKRLTHHRPSTTTPHHFPLQQAADTPQTIHHHTTPLPSTASG